MGASSEQLISQPWSGRCKRYRVRSISRNLSKRSWRARSSTTGAEQALLFLRHGSEQRIEAKATTHADRVEVTFSAGVRRASRISRVAPSLCGPDAGKRDPGRCLNRESVFRRRIRASQAPAVRPVPATGKAAGIDRRALPGEQPGAARLHAGPAHQCSNCSRRKPRSRSEMPTCTPTCGRKTETAGRRKRNCGKAPTR